MFYFVKLEETMEYKINSIRSTGNFEVFRTLIKHFKLIKLIYIDIDIKKFSV